MIFTIITFIGLCLLITCGVCAYYDRPDWATPTLAIGLFMILFGLLPFFQPANQPTNPYPSIPSEKYRAYRNSGHYFYVESNKVYAVKNGVVYLGPYTINVEK